MKIPAKCWYCGKTTMVPDAMGAKCRECGATWSPTQKLGHRVLGDPEPDSFSRSHASPGAGARVRNLKTGELLKTPPEDDSRES